MTYDAVYAINTAIIQQGSLDTSHQATAGCGLKENLLVIQGKKRSMYKILPGVCKDECHHAIMTSDKLNSVH